MQHGGVTAYTGLLGSGKTYSMVDDAFQLFLDRRPGEQPLTIFTNMTGLRFPGAVYIGGYEDLLKCQSGLILIDEASLWMPSRLWAKLPFELMYKFNQARKDGLQLFFTAQNMERVDCVLRDIVNLAVRCKSLISGRYFIRVTKEPKCKEIVNWQFRSYQPRIYRLYNTLEKIGNPATGMGRDRREIAGGLALPINRRSPYDSPQILNEVDYVAYMRRRGWQLSDDEKLVYRWLLYRGLVSRDTINWIEFVEHHTRRRRYLKTFGLTLDDVAPWITADCPWSVPPPENVTSMEPGNEALTNGKTADEIAFIASAVWHPWPVTDSPRPVTRGRKLQGLRSLFEF